MTYYDVRINAKLLKALRMLADWQLREAGYDPASITEAWASVEEKAKAAKKIQSWSELDILLEKKEESL